MITSFFKDSEKLGDSSKFVAWKTILEVDVLQYVQVNIPESPENVLSTTTSKYKKGEIKAKSIIIDGL